MPRSMPPSSSARKDCSPPYYFDPMGKKHFKADCF
jgi:hypothetical protein